MIVRPDNLYQAVKDLYRLVVELSKDVASATVAVFTTTTDGTVPAPGAVAGKYLKDDGTWDSPAATVADGDKGDVTVSGGGTVWNIDAGVITDTEVAVANKDGAAGTASLRTLGTGATQAAAGNHNHAGVYSPVGHTHAESDITNLVTDLAAKVGTSRTINTTLPITGGGTLAADLTLALNYDSTLQNLGGNLRATGDTPLVLGTWTMSSGMSRYIASYAELAAGNVFEIASGSVLEVG